MERGALECIQSYWIILFTVSATVNCVVILNVILVAASRAIWPLRRKPSKRKQPAAAVNGESTHINRQQLASILSEILANLAVFVGGFYALLNGAVANPFTYTGNQSCLLVDIATVVSSISIGRLAVTLASAFLRINSINILSVMRMFEDLFSLVTNAMLLSTNEAFLTRALLCIMPIDNHLYDIEKLIIKHQKGESRDLVIKLKVIRCFLAIAFRGTVPLTSCIISLVAFRGNVFDMQVLSVASVVASAVFYLFNNTFVVIWSSRDVWLAYSRQGAARRAPLNNKLPYNRKRVKIPFAKNYIARPGQHAKNGTKTSESRHPILAPRSQTRTGIVKTGTSFRTMSKNKRTRKKLIIVPTRILESIKEGSEA